MVNFEVSDRVFNRFMIAAAVAVGLGILKAHPTFEGFCVAVGACLVVLVITFFFLGGHKQEVVDRPEIMCYSDDREANSSIETK